MKLLRVIEHLRVNGCDWYKKVKKNNKNYDNIYYNSKFDKWLLYILDWKIYYILNKNYPSHSIQCLFIKINI